MVNLKFYLRSSINFHRCVPVAVTAKQDTREKEIRYNRERVRGRGEERESEGARGEEEERVRKEEKRVVRLLQNIRC